MKCVVLYDPAADVRERAPRHFAAHKAWADRFQANGTLLMIGTFADLGAHGAMAIFTNRAAAQEFVDGDPFVVEGVVCGVELRDWNEGLVPD